MNNEKTFDADGVYAVIRLAFKYALALLFLPVAVFLSAFGFAALFFVSLLACRTFDEFRRQMRTGLFGTEHLSEMFRTMLLP